jgi:hypothetical protein
MAQIAREILIALREGFYRSISSLGFGILGLIYEEESRSTIIRKPSRSTD